MLKRSLWDELRMLWPTAATTGWDHWMRLSTTHKGRECIAPSVPRTKHIATHGTNVQTKAQVHRYALFAFAAAKANLHGFDGALPKLELAEYDRVLRERIASGTRVAPQQINGAYSRTPVAVVPYNRVEFTAIARRLKLIHVEARVSSIFFRFLSFVLLLLTFLLFLPSLHKGAHRGVITLRSRGGSEIFLVDRAKVRSRHRPRRPPPVPPPPARTPLTLPPLSPALSPSACLPQGGAYLTEAERTVFPPSATQLAASRGVSCSEACVRRGQRCSDQLMQFVNDCDALSQLFKCEGGCGHQVGKDIPCYVADAARNTAQQCLISDGSEPLACTAKHPSTQRACVCV